MTHYQGLILLSLLLFKQIDPNSCIIPQASYYTTDHWTWDPIQRFSLQKNPQRTPKNLITYFTANGDRIGKEPYVMRINTTHKHPKEHLDPSAPIPQVSAYIIHDITSTYKMWELSPSTFAGKPFLLPEYHVMFFDKNGRLIRDRHFFNEASKVNSTTLTKEDLAKLVTKNGEPVLDISKILAEPEELSYHALMQKFINDLFSEQSYYSDKEWFCKHVDTLLQSAEYDLHVPRWCINNMRTSLAKTYFSCLKKWILTLEPRKTVYKKTRDFANSEEVTQQQLKNVMSRMKSESSLCYLDDEEEFKKTVVLFKELWVQDRGDRAVHFTILKATPVKLIKTPHNKVIKVSPVIIKK